MANTPLEPNLRQMRGEENKMGYKANRKMLTKY